MFLFSFLMLKEMIFPSWSFRVECHLVLQDSVTSIFLLFIYLLIYLHSKTGQQKHNNNEKWRIVQAEIRKTPRGY